jgi:immune inhibitor A
MERKQTLPVFLLVVSLTIFFLCCLCVVLWVAFTTIANRSIGIDEIQTLTTAATPTPVVLRPAETAETGSIIEPGAPAVALNLPADPFEILNELSNAQVPINDYYDLARRLEGIANVSPTLEPPTSPYRVGDQKNFWVADNDANKYFQIQATLRQVTDHAYFWIQDGVNYQEDDLIYLAETFENQIYPTNREFFGSEWTPGVDGDPHIYILYASDLGGRVAGYFSSNDSYNPQIQEYSNGHEMFVLNADSTGLDEDYTYGTLAHEFQHMIHWYRDRNETTWMNEGFSDLAMFLNGYDIGGHDYLYASNPDLQLNYWPSDETAPHYGASFLFMNYFLDRFGEQATRALLAHPENDLQSIDATLRELGVTDLLTGEAVDADRFFADWAVATYLQDGSVGDGRYTYNLYPDAPQPTDTETIRDCDTSLQTRDVNQYGIDYIYIDCRKPTTLQFEGSTLVRLQPEDAHSGLYTFWSNRGDESDMTLTRSFDFSEHSGPLTFTYWTWYDIEEDFDYAYLLASEDGDTWQILFTPSGTGDDPTGSNYGWGYTGTSGGGPRWVQESVDISEFAGKEVQLRFEYITDAAVNGEGLLLDDVGIPETEYFTDFEDDDGGWQAAGFVRTQNLLPQMYQLSLITFGETVEVTPVQLSLDNTAEIALDFGGQVDEAVLVVSGSTRFTRQPAAYRFSFLP